MDYIVRTKTGALIKASLVCGAVLAGGEREQVELLGRYGQNLGAMFQIKDDLLDLEGDPVMGKAVRRMIPRGKATYPDCWAWNIPKEMIRELLASSRWTLFALWVKGPNRWRC